MAKGKRKIVPSKIKYDKSHPTVSCRVSKEFYDRLCLAAKGESFADILKTAFETNEAQIRKIEEARQQGLTEGYKKGFEEAKNCFWDEGYEKGSEEARKESQEEEYNRGFKAGKGQGWNEGYRQGITSGKNTYGVAYACNVCGKPLWVDSDEERKAIAAYMKKSGWGHESCHENRQFAKLPMGNTQEQSSMLDNQEDRMAHILERVLWRESLGKREPD